MTCVTDGVLRARLDGELSETELLEINNHLATCAECHGRADAMARDAAQVRDVLSNLAPAAGDAPADARMAFARFRTRMAQEGATEAPAGSLLSRLFSPRLAPAWGAVAALILVAVFMSFAPARSWAQRVLAMLRVQKISVVPIDVASFDKASGVGRNLTQLLSDNLVVTMKPGKPQLVSTPEQASELAGFKVRVLGSRTDAPRIEVKGEAAFHMTVNRERLQSILDEAGRSDLQLPASVDGATVAVYVPKIATVQYGDCASVSRGPAPGGAKHEFGKRDNGENNPTPTAGNFATDRLHHWLAPRNEKSALAADPCAELTEVPSPTVSVPPDLNMQQIAELGLQITGMSPEEAQAFSQTVDWTSTLVLGIPRGMSYQTVEVDGVQATLVELPRRGDRRPAYALLWVKSGIIYGLTAGGSAADAVTLAESLN